MEAVTAENVSILLGANTPEATIHLEVRHGAKDEPLAIRTMFGWSLFGTSFKNSDSKDFTCNPVNTSEEDKIHEMVENFWAQENYGIAPERDTGMSKQDKEAELKLNSHTKMVDGKYEIPMLWKDETVTLPSNLSQATNYSNS